jgi:Got1/Sft2-like family
MSLAGTLTLIGGPTSKNITTFAVLYVMGNVIALLATGFLLGPKSQCIKMWDPSRRFTTAFYLAMLIIVFSVAVAKQHVALVLFLLFIQILAGIWYTASYIPFAQKMIIAFFRNTLCKPCCDAAGQSNNV